MMDVLSVVIPAYNEEGGIADIVERVLGIRPALAAQEADLELIVVDDGSRDETAQIVSRYPGVKLVRHAINCGYGAALKTGFAQARGQWLGFLDADGTYPPEYLPRMLEVGRCQGAELVIGSRMAGTESQMPLSRRIGNLFFARLVSLIGRQHVSDSASGMRLIRRDVLSRLYPLPDGLNFTPVMSTRALHEGIQMVEAPIPYAERVGRSKLTILGDGTRFLESIVWTALCYNPVRILGAVGLGSILLTLLIALVLVALRLAGITELGTWGTLALFGAQVLMVGGVSLFALGATFNYLVSLFHQERVRTGLFGRPLFDPPLEERFGWLGLATLAGGLILGAISSGLGFAGWPVSRLWLYLLASAMLLLVGLQLVVSWTVMRVLAELTQRESLIQGDMVGSLTMPAEELAVEGLSHG
ncbi:MAG TPA: glycosyltransferase family 2 protein [Anaerolineae bacterium]|nr:glycosyltransferase family 2 protein [Anaerolineae bacterium]